MIVLLALGAALAEDLHVVRAGEDVAAIAASYGLSEAALRLPNGLQAGEAPAVGTVLRIPAADATRVDALVLALAGAGRAEIPGSGRASLYQGQSIPTGSRVCTEAESYTTLRLAAVDTAGQHDEITLLGGTCITLDASTVRSGRRNSVLSVLRGSVAVRENGVSPGSVSVRGGTAVTSGAEGGFRVTMEEKGSARTEALYKPVAVAGAGEERAVPAGFGVRVEAGLAPGELVALLPPGTPTRPLDGTALRRPDFEWQPVPYALLYRVEISTTADFSDLVLVMPVDAARWLPERLALPSTADGWYWRVASVDRTGFVGVPSVAFGVLLPAGLTPAAP